MGKACPVDLGVKKFRSKSEAMEFFHDMLQRYWPGDRVSDEDAEILAELLKRHPDSEAKIGEGIDHFEVMSHSFNSKCFAVHRTDRSFEDFSYHWCVAGKK